MIHTFFNTLGFNQKETAIYMYLTSHGPQVASIIAKKMNLKRASIYTILKSMVDKGLLIDYTKNKVTYFKGVEPEDITLLFKKKEIELKKLKNNSEKIQQDLEKLKEKQVQDKFDLAGKITYYEGIEAVSNLIDETLEEKGKEELCFGLNDIHTKIHSDDWGDYTKKRVEKGIFVKSIQPDTPEAIDYASRDKKELRKTKLIPNEKYPSFSEINIIGDMVALFTAKGNKPTGMKMYNKYMANTLRSLFNLAWDKIDKEK